MRDKLVKTVEKRRFSTKASAYRNSFVHLRRYSHQTSVQSYEHLYAIIKFAS